MLILSRFVGEEIDIDGGAIRLKILEIRGGKVRVGIAAPRSVRVDRSEITARRGNAAKAVEAVAMEGGR